MISAKKARGSQITNANESQNGVTSTKGFLTHFTCTISFFHRAFSPMAAMLSLCVNSSVINVQAPAIRAHLELLIYTPKAVYANFSLLVCEREKVETTTKKGRWMRRKRLNYVYTTVLLLRLLQKCQKINYTSRIGLAALTDGFHIAVERYMYTQWVYLHYCTGKAKQIVIT